MLDNTDTALAKTIDMLRESATQISPDAVAAAGQVAMLHAQGSLLFAHVFLCLTALAFVLSIWGAIASLSRGAEDGGAFLVALSIAIMIVFGVSLTAALSPLRNAIAHDPKLALAYEVMEKMGESAQK